MEINIKPNKDLGDGYGFNAIEICFTPKEIGFYFEIGLTIAEAKRIGVAAIKLENILKKRGKK